VLLCVASLASERATAQTREGSVPTTADPAKTSRDPGDLLPTGPDSAKGGTLYRTYCSACHGANGEGRTGMYPPLKGSRVVTKDDATKHIHVVLDGLKDAKAGGVVYANPMPPFGNILSNIDIADIIDFERSSWGNHGKQVTAAQIAAQRNHSK
jgi:cytochrome c oxidase cbb3-type subunit 2